jgi:peptidoglycan/LPS O-acetylase OafA/YrhL
LSPECVARHHRAVAISGAEISTAPTAAAGEGAVADAARLPGLDLIRASAIGCVLVCHGALIVGAAGFQAPLARNLGPLGVDLFFGLSGFLVGGMLLDLGSRLGRGRVIAGFWAARALRILPNYYLFLLLAAALRGLRAPAVAFPWPVFGRSLLFLQNLTHPPDWFFVESWSVCVEEWFYLLLPLALWLGLKTGLRFGAAFGSALAAMLVVPLVARLALPVPHDWGFEVNMVVVNKLDAIGWGVLAAWVARRFPAAWSRWSVLSLVGAAVLLVECQAFALRPDFGQHWLSRAVFPALQPLGGVLLLPAASLMRGTPGSLAEAAIGRLARWSYAIYFVNFPLCVLVLVYVPAPLRSGAPGAATWAILHLAASVGFAALVYRFVERPLLRRRNRIALCREAAVPVFRPRRIAMGSGR